MAPQVPVLDGSSLGWVCEIQNAGVRPAPRADGSPEPMPRLARAPSEPVTVFDGTAFISYVPDATMRVSYGIDHSSDSKVIGKQWFTWNVETDDHYR